MAKSPIQRHSIKRSPAIRLFGLGMLFSISIVLSGCSVFNSSQIRQNNLEKQLLIKLSPTPTELQGRIWLDKFTFKMSKQKPSKDNQPLPPQNLLLQTELNAHQISLAAMSFEGLPFAQARWNAENRQLESESRQQNFDSLLVLHDLQAIHWPLKSIEKALYAGISVSDAVVNNVKIRRFLKNGQVIAEVHYQDPSIYYEHFVMGYQLAITRLQNK